MRFGTKQAHLALYGTRPERLVIADGPRRSGKTEAALQGFSAFTASALSGHMCPVVAPSQVQMDKLIDRIRDYYESHGGYFRRAPKQKAGKAWEVPSLLGELPNQYIEVIADGSEKAAQRVKSVEYGAAFFDEMTDIYGLKPEQQDLYRHIEAGMWTVPQSKIVCTTNPEGPFHPVYTDMIQSSKWYRIHFELADNPALTEPVLKDIMSSYTGVFFKRNVQGLWVAADGLVHPFFEKSETHPGTLAEPPDGEVPLARYVALDFGNHGVTAAGLFVEYQSCWHLESEWTWDAEEQGHKPPGGLADEIYKWATAGGTRTVRLFLVPEDASGVAESLGYLAAGTSARVDVPFQLKTEGINFVNMKLEGTGRCGKVLLVGDAPRFKREASSYSWDRRAAARGEDVPDKASGLGAHACDYVRYWAATDEALRRGMHTL